jgi:hypothetical protein
MKIKKAFLIGLAASLIAWLLLSWRKKTLRAK